MYIDDKMARQISVSDDVYEELSRLKGDKSFSEFIKEKMEISKDNKNIVKLAGILKKDGKKLNDLKRIIEEERKANYGREINW